jgi:lipopolysaccharide/colanic/teichoic acid biosynthesis glycosyltransferase
MMDFLSALFFVILLVPLALTIFVLFVVNGHRNVIYRQQRIGLQGKPFIIYKFRTLKEDSHLSLKERQFPLGSFLRATSLDELPQLINILKGEMSFIGPRPLPIAYMSEFSDEQRRRHYVRPGITGWAQVNGRHDISWSEKINFDLYYVARISFLLDVRIFFRTIALLLSFKRDNSLLEKPFKKPV